MSEIENIDDQMTSYDGVKKKLRNAAGILTLGIISIPFAGLLGIVMAIIALSLSKMSLKAYKENPEEYDPKSYRNVNIGRTCSIIGLIASVFWLAYVLQPS